MKTILKYIYFSIIFIISTLELNAQTWSQVGMYVASDRKSNGEFGSSVGISENYAIVGARKDSNDIANTNSMFGAGAAYIFERDSLGIWNQIQKIVAFDRDTFDHFGVSVAISGKYAIIGAEYEDEDVNGFNTVINAGSAYIFERNDTTGMWSEVQKIVAPARSNDDNFGHSVSIMGDYAVIGAYQEDEDENEGNYLINSGSVYIFKRNFLGQWLFHQKIVGFDREYGDEFGISVSISGNSILIGAHYEDEDENSVNSLAESGAIYFFEKDSLEIWNQVQKIVAFDRDNADCFGRSVSISGNYAIAGAAEEDEDEDENNTILQSGSAYVLERDSSGNWVLVQKIVSSERTSGSNFGKAVAISGEVILVGQYNWGSNPETYIFKRDSMTNQWTESQKITGCDDQSVAISNNYIITGTPYEAYDEMGANSLNASGACYIYEICLPDTIIDAYNKCNSFVWLDGITYTTSTNTPIITLTNSVGCDSIVILDLTINTPIASFNSIDNSSGNYSFNNTSTGSFNKTHWAFGDGTTSTATNPNHTFTANGTYVVVLTVNDSTTGSTCRDYYLDTIVVSGVVAPLQCAAGFVMYPNGGDVTVVNSSTGTNLTYLWDFGDGNTSTQAYPTHTYATADNYYLCLTVDDGAGCVNMYCDSIGENGVVFNKQTGFTINVIAPPLVTQVSEQEVLSTSMSIYPNPTGSLLNVVFKQNELYQLKITAIDGKIIDAKTINGNTIFDVSKYSSGMYFISASNKEGKVFQSKFVKE